MASGVYSGIVATPAYSPAAGTYPASDYPKTITIATGTAGSNIRYTTNGTAPTTTTGTLIAASSGTASVPGGATLKAIAFKSGYSNSGVASGVYAVVPQVAPVIIDDDCGSNGCYPNYAHVTMSTGTANATIFYTASTSGWVTPTHSGATPTGNTAIYSGPIEVVFQRKYFSAVGYKAGLNDSGVTQFEEDNTNPNLRPAPIQPAAASAAMGGGAAPEWSAPARTVGYVLDKAGNRLSVEESDVGVKSYTPNNLNQYTDVDGAPINHGASHETTGHEGVAYSYVGDRYLARATAGSNTYTLYYDALGRCVKRKLNGVSKYYLFDGEHWIMEYDATGANISNVLYGLGIDEILGRGVSGQPPQWPLPDRNGNTSVVTTNGGAILEQYRYDAFGAPTITDANGAVRSVSAINNPFLFTGREWAPANLGFYEYRARAYHPGLGRFMSEDPIGFDAKDYNLFRYVSNDPLDRTDPMGLDPGDVIIYRENNPVQTLIGRVTLGGNAGHVGLELPGGGILTARPRDGVTIDAASSTAGLNTTRLRPTTSVNQKEMLKFAAEAIKNNSEGYDYSALVGKQTQNGKEYTCASLCEKGLQRAGVPVKSHRVTTPNDLANDPHLKEVPTVKFEKPIDSLIPRPVLIPQKYGE